MSAELAGSIGLLLLCLLLSFFFSATETAITSAGKIKMRSLESSNPNKKDMLRWLGDNIQRALTITLVGNNLVNIAASTIATTVAMAIFGRYGPIIAISIMTALIVVFCEILPKNIAIANKESVITTVLSPLKLCNFLLAPVIYVVQLTVLGIGRIFNLKLDSSGTFVTREDVEVMVNASSESGELEEGERKMIRGVISFEGTRVSEIMVPRRDMLTLPEGTTVSEAVQIFLESGHSRVPTHEKDLDKITGVLYAKDLLAPLCSGLIDAPASTMSRKPLFIPETIKTDEAFELMKKEQVHIAIVVDEYGGTAGLVSLEDLLEEIVGDIQDEYDDETPDMQEEAPGVYVVQGYVNLEDLSEILGYSFEFDDVDTVAGMLLTLFGNFPSEGESVIYGPWELTAVEVTDYRILKVRVKPVEKAEKEVTTEA